MSLKTEENAAPISFFLSLSSYHPALTINNARCSWSWGSRPIVQKRPILNRREKHQNTKCRTKAQRKNECIILKSAAIFLSENNNNNNNNNKEISFNLDA